MSQNADGSRAMTIYIVICFGLALVALGAFKVKNDERADLAQEYRLLSQQVVDMQDPRGGMAKHIGDYYRLVKMGTLTRVNKAVKDDTYRALKAAAENLGILEAAGEQGRLKVVPGRAVMKFNEYQQAFCDVELNRVTQSEWAAFLRVVLDPHSAENVLDDYIVVESFEASRIEQNFSRMAVSPEMGGRHTDSSLWKVTIRFIWFSPKDEI